MPFIILKQSLYPFLFLLLFSLKNRRVGSTELPLCVLSFILFFLKLKIYNLFCVWMKCNSCIFHNTVTFLTLALVFVRGKKMMESFFMKLWLFIKNVYTVQFPWVSKTQMRRKILCSQFQASFSKHSTKSVLLRFFLWKCSKTALTLTQLLPGLACFYHCRLKDT